MLFCRLPTKLLQLESAMFYTFYDLLWLYVTGLVEGVPHKNIVSVAVGEAHSLALTDDGVVYSWGSGCSGELGRSCSTNSSNPRFVTLGT